MADLCTDEVLLWLFMAIGRRDPKHPFHPYLASLPVVAPDAANWPEDHRAGLEATPVAADVAKARALAADDHGSRVRCMLWKHACFGAWLVSRSRIAVRIWVSKDRVRLGLCYMSHRFSL